MISVKVEGADKLMKALNELPTRVSRNVQREALKAGGELIRQHAASIAPREPGRPDLADNIGMAVARLEDGSVGLAIGPGPSFFYGYFQEFGTRHHKAQPFMRPAWDAEQAKALKVISAEMWTALIRRGAGSGRGSGGGVGL